MGHAGGRPKAGRWAADAPDVNWAKARGGHGRPWRRAGDERGASLVEFAFVVPILALLLFGVIDFGIALGDSISQRQGVRDAGRQVAVGTWTNDMSCTNNVTSGGDEVKKIVCLAKQRIDLKDSSVSVRVQLGSGASPYVVGEPVAVCAQYPMHSASGFFRPLLNGKYLRSKVVMRIETLKTSATLTEGGEPAPAGKNWNWCTTS